MWACVIAFSDVIGVAAFAVGFAAQFLCCLVPVVLVRAFVRAMRRGGDED